MLERGEKAKFAKHVFYAALNDIDVFIEDTASESKKIYVQLLKRALGSDIKLSQVFPIGTKSRVIERCGQDQGIRLRRAVYIVDGDHDLLNGIPLPGLIRFYRLKRYCIENYFVDQEALIDVLDEEVVNREKSEIRRIFDFDGWLQHIASSLRPLIVASAVTQVKKCGLSNVNIPLSELCSCDTGGVDVTKVITKVSDLKIATDHRYGAGVFDEYAATISKRLPLKDTSCLIAHASGKSLLFPLLKRRSRSLFGFSHADAALRLRLAMRCDVEELRDVAAAIA